MGKPTRTERRVRELQGRVTAWQRMLRARGGIRMESGLLASCALDLLRFLVSPARAPSPKTYVSGVVVFRIGSSGLARFHIRQGTDDLYSCTPGREPGVRESLERLLRPGDVFVDIGANVGFYSVVAGRLVGERGRVIAIEPIPSTAEVLRTNLMLNGTPNAALVMKACGSSRGRARLSNPPGAYGLAASRRPAEGRVTEVDVVPLDEICGGIPSIRLIKIDVEGAEREVLTGARKTLDRADGVIVEISQNDEDVLGLLRHASFDLVPMEFRPYVLGIKQPRLSS